MNAARLLVALLWLAAVAIGVLVLTVYTVATLAELRACG